MQALATIGIAAASDDYNAITGQDAAKTTAMNRTRAYWGLLSEQRALSGLPPQQLRVGVSGDGNVYACVLLCATAHRRVRADAKDGSGGAADDNEIAESGVYACARARATTSPRCCT